MARQEIDITRTVHAPPATVFALLGDSAMWPTWTPIDSFELVEPAADDGRGEVRVFRTGRITVREEVVERVPDRRLGYVLLAGLAVRDYRADIDLTPAGDGTAVRWHTTFRARVPAMGFVYRRALAKATQQFVDGLAAEAERRVT